MFILLIFLLIPIFSATASSPYVPIDCWVYSYLDELKTKGYLNSLNYSERPFTRQEISDCLEEIPKDVLTDYDKNNIEDLLLFLKKASSNNNFSNLQAEAGDNLNYYDTASTNWFAKLGLFIETPSFSGIIRARGEEWYKTSPLYPWKQDRAAAVRFSDNYIKTDTKHFTFSLGRTCRLWGPFYNKSLILSDNAFSFDHLYFQMRISRFSLSQIIGELDEKPKARRFIGMHRLDIKCSNSLAIGVFESMLYAQSNISGVRDYDLRYINPFSIYFFEQMNNQNLGTDGNSIIGADAAYQSKLFNLKGQFIIDDIQVDNKDSHDQEPPMWGVLFGADIFTPYLFFNKSRYLTVEAEKITNRVFNASSGLERYTYYDSGLTAPFNDCENLSVAYNFSMRPDLLSKLKIELNLLGEGRITGTWADTIIGGNLGFRSEKSPTGTVYSTKKILLDNIYRPNPYAEVEADIGYCAENNIDNISGSNNSGITFLLKFSFVFSKFFYLKSDM